jgi:hypothetical protein
VNIPAKYLRRGLTCSLMALCASHLPACTTLEVGCNTKAVEWGPVETEGDVLLTWSVDRAAVVKNCGLRKYGCTSSGQGRVHVWLADTSNKSAECVAWELSHELRHALGARHD